LFDKDLLKKMGFSNKAIEYLTQNKNYGKIENADAEGTYTGKCGDTIITYLKIENDIIKDAKFVYTGCVGSASSGSAVTEMAKGKKLEDVKNFSLQDIIEFYREGEKSIPRIKYECGEIAINSMKNAIKNYEHIERIAFASDGKEMESSLAQHFGRCLYYIFVDIKNGEIKNIEAKKNPFFDNHEPGVVPRFIAEEKTDVIISGGMGQKAIDWFEKLNVRPITTEPRKIKDILNDYLNGKLKEAEPCKEGD